MLDHVHFIVSEWKFQIRIRKFVLFSDEPKTGTLEALYFKVMFHEKHRQTWMRGTCLCPHVSTSKYTKRKLCFCLPFDLTNSWVYAQATTVNYTLIKTEPRSNESLLYSSYIVYTLDSFSIQFCSLSLIGVRWLGHVREVLLTFLRVLDRRFV